MNETQARGLEKRNDDRVSVIIPALNEAAYTNHDSKGHVLYANILAR
jgi:hypothetical protein